MNLATLKEILNDQLMMAGIYTAIRNSAQIGRESCEFLFTHDYPNRHNSVINKQQVEALVADGYKVKVVDTAASNAVIVVSGWK